MSGRQRSNFVPWRNRLSVKWSKHTSTTRLGLSGCHGFSFPRFQRLGPPGGSDISFGVIHGRAKRPRAARRSEVVNNSAAGEDSAGGRPASARSRSREGYRKTVNRRLPGEPEALATTSNRTTPQEGCNISSMDGRAKRRQEHKLKSPPMNNPEQQAGS